MYLKMLSAEVVCCKQLPNITDELSIEANSVSTLFAIEASQLFQQTRKADDFCCDCRIKG